MDIRTSLCLLIRLSLPLKSRPYCWMEMWQMCILLLLLELQKLRH